MILFAKSEILPYSRLLVSNGAHAFVTRRGVTSVPPGSLVSPRAQAQWEIWKSRLASGNGDSLPISNREDLSGQHIVQDTVGAIVFDVQSTLSSGVSRYEACLLPQNILTTLIRSGGLLLKLPGRVGEVKSQPNV